MQQYYGSISTNDTNLNPAEAIYANEYDVCINVPENGIIEIGTISYFAYNNLEDYPPIYFAYKIGNYLQDEVLLKKEHLEPTLINNGQSGRSFPGYKFTLVVSIDIGCTPPQEVDYFFGLITNPNGNMPGGVNSSGSTFPSSQSFGYNLYPIQDYNGESELFSIEAFPHNDPNSSDFELPYLKGFKLFCECGSTSRQSVSVEDNNGNSLIPQYEKLQNIASKNIISISPNPFTKDLNINFKEHNLIPNKIIVSDLSGRVIWTNEQLEVKTTKINTVHWEKGLYIISYLLDDEVFCKKLLKK